MAMSPFFTESAIHREQGRRLARRIRELALTSRGRTCQKLAEAGIAASSGGSITMKAAKGGRMCLPSCSARNATDDTARPGTGQPSGCGNGLGKPVRTGAPG